MVRQGDIIKLNFNPQAGHEQAGYRPALVISNDFFNHNSLSDHKHKQQVPTAYSVGRQNGDDGCCFV